MAKRVILVGNSFAITLDKKICRLLRIDTTTPIEMRLVGDRLVFDIFQGKARVLSRDEIGFLERHVQRSDLTLAQFSRLSDGAMSKHLFLMTCSVRGHIDPQLARRLFACFERRRFIAETWDATIDAVLAGIPGPIASEDFHSIPPDELASLISTRIDEDNAGGPAAKARAEWARAVVEEALHGKRDDAPDEGDESEDLLDKPVDESLYTAEAEEPSLEPVSIPL